MESQKVHAKFGCDCRKRRLTLLSHDTTIKIAVKIGNCNFRTTLPPTTAAADHYYGTYDLCLTRLNGTILQSHIKGPYFYYDSTLRSFHNLIGQLNAPRKKSQMTNNGPSVRNSRSMWRVTQIDFAWCSWNKNNLHSRACTRCHGLRIDRHSLKYSLDRSCYNRAVEHATQPPLSCLCIFMNMKVPLAPDETRRGSAGQCAITFN